MNVQGQSHDVFVGRIAIFAIVEQGNSETVFGEIGPLVRTDLAEEQSQFKAK